MFTQLALQNFKAWRDTGSIRLAPLTVFFGANSAGKTSLLQFLPLLRQSAESRDRHQVLHPGDETTDVDLGSFRDLIYHHNEKLPLAFHLSWSLPAPLHVHNPLTNATYSGAQLAFQARLRAAAHRLGVDHLAYTLGDPAHSTLAIHLRKKSPGHYHATASPPILVPRPGPPPSLPAPLRFYGFPEELYAAFQNAAFSSDLVLALEQQLRRLRYLGPLRQKPKRTYTWSGEAPESVGFDGRHAIAALLAAPAPLRDTVARWMKQLDLLEDFTAQPLSRRHAKQYEIAVAASRSGVRANLPDVGFGVSQVLPVVVESFYAPPHSTIVIEQPELHLHPRVQAYLADLFAEAIHVPGRPLQFLIESHSEHFLYRLQRLIAESRLAPSEVALYFCQPGPQGSTLEPLEIDAFGNVLNWPDNFFGNEMEDVAARLEAAARQAENCK